MFMMVLLSLMVFNLFVFFSSHDSGRPLPWELHGQPLSTDSELENRLSRLHLQTEKGQPAKGSELDAEARLSRQPPWLPSMLDPFLQMVSGMKIAILPKDESVLAVVPSKNLIAELMELEICHLSLPSGSGKYRRRGGGTGVQHVEAPEIVSAPPGGRTRVMCRWRDEKYHPIKAN
ncbi:hypothetical protein ACSQ67_008972 [Phaseolus vulgaris]